MRFDVGRDTLIAALRGDRAGRVREAAALALGRLDADAVPAVAALAATLNDDYRPARRSGGRLTALGEGGPRRPARAASPPARRDAEPAARIQAALALGRIGDAEGVPALTDALAETTAPAEVRCAVAEALGMLGKEAAPAASALAAALSEPSAGTELRRAVAGALDQLGAEAGPALPALAKALRDEDKFVRCLAMHAIGQMSDLKGEGRAIITALLQGLNDGVAEVRVAAIETLGRSGRSVLVPIRPPCATVLPRLLAIRRKRCARRPLPPWRS